MFVFSSIFFLLVILYLGFVIAAKMDKIKQLQADVDTLKHNLDEMDEQAKLVVRTDIELNKTQEELDRKINSLYTLQKISRIISTFLEEKQIFKSIEAENLKELGFEKAIAFLYDENRERFSLELTIGYEERSFPIINQFIEGHKTIFIDMIRREKTLSTISIPEGIPLREDIKNRFGAALFIISPILPKEGNKGLLFVGTTNADIPLTEGDEEVITVLSNQLGQSLENARLFEKTWRAQQESEHKVEEKTRDLKSALEEKEKISKRKTDFVSRVSHELRTPLTSVKGYASLLLAGKLGNLPEEAKQRIEKLNKHSDELVRMVNDLLDIARIESGKVTMKQEPVDLKRILDDVSDMLSVQMKEKQIEFTASMPDGLPSVFADPTQIKRVFINLINNAIKFTPQNGKITVTGHKEQDGVKIDVTDTGCGIPVDAQDSIFSEFYRVDNPVNQQVKGTGLGLALVKNIVEAHKGTIAFKSKIGVGTTFSFMIPTPPAP